jgi:hypothetical protein
MNDSIIDMFNSCIHCEDGNRRGIGFDKPEMDYEKDGPTCQCVSPSSFGHTGFTGTMAWADPETGIIYVFLSNKIHPDQDNPKLVSAPTYNRYCMMLSYIEIHETMKP